MAIKKIKLPGMAQPVDIGTTWANVSDKPDLITSEEAGVYMQKGVDYVTAGQKSGTTLGRKATAEGVNTTASGQTSHAEGDTTTASGPASHAEGYQTTAFGEYSHAEGLRTLATGRNVSHAEGSTTISIGSASHAEGSITIAKGNCSHAEGNGHSLNRNITYTTLEQNRYKLSKLPSGCQVSDIIVVNNNIYTISSIDSTDSTIITTSPNLPSGSGALPIDIIIMSPTKAFGQASHAEGWATNAIGDGSHAEGHTTNANGMYTHAEGKGTTASGQASHAEGEKTTASESYSHAEGKGTTASGQASHAEGYQTTANHRSQHVFGEYNTADDSTAIANNKGNYVEIVGNGTSDGARSNARTLDWNGNEVLAGKLTVGAAPTENMDVATKQYVDNILATNDAMIFKGTIGTNGTITALPATHQAGWTYKVITADSFAGQACEIGDMIICIADGETATNDDWIVVQTNVDGAVTGPASSTAGHIATFTGTTGKVIQDSGFTIATSVPANAVFTDTTYENKTAASGGTDVSLVSTGEKYNWNNATPKIGFISFSTNWSGSGPYTQIVTVTGTTITANSKIDLQPLATVIEQLVSDGVKAFYIINNNGTLTATAMGAAPSTAILMQCSVVEVNPPTVLYISFTISGMTYQAEEGMTWEEWVNSSYNPGGFYISDTHVIYNNSSVCYPQYYTLVFSTEQIINGESYIFSSGGSMN